MDLHHDFHLKPVPLSLTRQRLVSAAGLGSLIEAFDVSPLRAVLEAALPSRDSPRSLGSYRLALIQIMSFCYGHECLDDLEEFRTDPFLSEILKGESVAPRTMGDFLRDFEAEHLVAMNLFLATQSKAYRVQLEKMLKKPFKPSLAPHLFIDSTSHVQRGVKIDGVAFNYKDEWCLDSQTIFDELGLAWDFELRPGNTKSGVGAREQLTRAFSSYKFESEKYLSADAAYCFSDVITTCLSLGVKFTLTANQATTVWEDHIPEIVTWIPWQYSKEEKADAIKKDYTLPEVELGHFFWRPSWNDVLMFPVVVKRTKARTNEQLELLGGEYHYYGIVTNHNLAKESLQHVVEHHNERGNAENFIRELKYGYDLKHFPCLEMKANHAYGALAMVAHNMLRWIAQHDNPQHPRFSKYIRRRYIHLPGKLVSHARTLVLKVTVKVYEEVNRIREALGLTLYPPVPEGFPSG